MYDINDCDCRVGMVEKTVHHRTMMALSVELIYFTKSSMTFQLSLLLYGCFWQSFEHVDKTVDQYIGLFLYCKPIQKEANVLVNIKQVVGQIVSQIHLWFNEMIQ